MKRNEGESFDDYRKRRKSFDDELYDLKRGKLIWNSDKQGQRVGHFRKDKQGVV